ncbi:MAG TPA: hypothetical protein VLL52_23315 [Anaerolineae bacterium]|nr:hypothetical protein [Anaerolineae bacterium]
MEGVVPNNQQFNGLPMPVFAAFGWMGEETAINYALSQLELFIEALHQQSSRDIRHYFTHYGLDKTSQTVYFASHEEAEKGAQIAFYARPLSFQMLLTMSNKDFMMGVWRRSKKDSAKWLSLLQEMEGEWDLRIQQMEWNEETGEMVFYKDLYKDSVSALDAETAKEVTERAYYLNGDEKWAVVFSLGHTYESEDISSMGRQVVEVVAERMKEIVPLVEFMASFKRKPTAPRVATAAAVPVPVSRKKAGGKVISQTSDEAEGFTHVALLKPLHLRRGFINLTPEHWPFFQAHARMETRPVKALYGEQEDTETAVWRLLPNDQARIVLSEPAQMWLEENFVANDKIKVKVVKLPNDEICVTLSPITG